MEVGVSYFNFRASLHGGGCGLFFILGQSYTEVGVAYLSFFRTSLYGGRCGLVVFFLGHPYMEVGVAYFYFKA